MTSNPEHVIQDMRFWQEAYLQALSAGHDNKQSKHIADQALLDYKIKTKMPYPQEGNE